MLIGSIQRDRMVGKEAAAGLTKEPAPMISIGKLGDFRAATVERASPKPPISIGPMGDSLTI